MGKERKPTIDAKPYHYNHICTFNWGGSAMVLPQVLKSRQWVLAKERNHNVIPLF